MIVFSVSPSGGRSYGVPKQNMAGIGSLAAQLKKTAGVTTSDSNENDEDPNAPKGRMS